MEKYFCEGSETDVITKEILWMKFKTEFQVEEDTRSTFFSLIGNTVFKNHPFSKVKPLRKQGKLHYYQYLRDKTIDSQIQ